MGRGVTCPIFGQWSDTRLGRGGPQNLTSRAFSGSNSRDSSAATATPPSTATTPPVPGAATGSGITAYATCQRPALSPVMGTTSAQGLGCLCATPSRSRGPARPSGRGCRPGPATRAVLRSAGAHAGPLEARSEAPMGSGKGGCPTSLPQSPNPCCDRLRPSSKPRLRTRASVCGLRVAVGTWVIHGREDVKLVVAPCGQRSRSAGVEPSKGSGAWVFPGRRTSLGRGTPP